MTSCWNCRSSSQPRPDTVAISGPQGDSRAARRAEKCWAPAGRGVFAPARSTVHTARARDGIFYSIQGESTLAASRPSSCASPAAICAASTANGVRLLWWKQMTREEILAEVARYPARSSAHRRGPTLQKELPQLAQELVDRVTSFAGDARQRPLAAIPRGVRKIVDLKTPGSDEPHTTSAPSATSRRRRGEGWSARATTSNGPAQARRAAGLEQGAVLFSPSYGQSRPRTCRLVLESGKPARLQLQLHKLIWGERRGSNDAKALLRRRLVRAYPLSGNPRACSSTAPSWTARRCSGSRTS